MRETPSALQERHLLFLDELRDCGCVNMFDATENLQERFDLAEEDAKEILRHWMRTFKERHA
jgi:hypothetical protein